MLMLMLMLMLMRFVCGLCCYKSAVNIHSLRLRRLLRRSSLTAAGPLGFFGNAAIMRPLCSGGGAYHPPPPQNVVPPLGGGYPHCVVGGRYPPRLYYMRIPHIRRGYNTQYLILLRTFAAGILKTSLFLEILFLF